MFLDGAAQTSPAGIRLIHYCVADHKGAAQTMSSRDESILPLCRWPPWKIWNQSKISYLNIVALSFAMTVWWIPFPVNEKKLWVTPAWKWIRRTTRSSAQVETRETIISARKIIMTCHQKDLMENVKNTQWVRIKWRLKAWSRGQNVMFEDE